MTGHLPTDLSDHPQPVDDGPCVQRVVRKGVRIVKGPYKKAEKVMKFRVCSALITGFASGR
jgi:hypothetical protein